MPLGIAYSAYDVFLHTRSAVTAAQYPRRLDYVISVSGFESGALKVNHYRASCDPADGSIRVLPISDEELAAPPPHPHDFELRQIIIQGISVPVGPAPNPDLLGGSPILEPTYTFGLKYQGVVNPTAESYTGDLPVIAVVSNGARQYKVTMLGQAVLNGEQTYHLGLTPFRKPKKYRLRELWIGTKDFLPRQALVAGNFTVAPLVDVPWLVAFEIIDGVPYLSHEDAQATLYLSHHHAVSHAVIEFQDVHETRGSLIGAPLIAPDVAPTNLVEP